MNAVRRRKAWMIALAGIGAFIGAESQVSCRTRRSGYPSADDRFRGTLLQRQRRVLPDIGRMTSKADAVIARRLVDL